MTLRIERNFDGYRTTIRLIGHVTAQHLADLRQMIAEGAAPTGRRLARSRGNRAVLPSRHLEAPKHANKGGSL